MTPERLLGSMPLLLGFVVLAALLQFLNRKGVLSLAIGWILASIILAAFLIHTGGPGSPYEWPTWGRVIVAIVVCLGMAAAIRLAASWGLASPLQVGAGVVVGPVLYVAVNALLIFVFPNRFWI